MTEVTLNEYLLKCVDNKLTPEKQAEKLIKALEKLGVVPKLKNKRKNK